MYQLLEMVNLEFNDRVYLVLRFEWWNYNILTI